MDNQGHLVPPGAPGELWVSSPGVSQGYIGLPEKTAQAFINNPFVSLAQTGKQSTAWALISTISSVSKLEGNILFKV